MADCPAGRIPSTCPDTCSCASICGQAIIDGRYTLKWEKGLNIESKRLRRLVGPWLLDRSSPQVKLKDL